MTTHSMEIGEIDDTRPDPAPFRTTTEAGRNSQRIANPEMRQTAGGFNTRIKKIPDTTGGLAEPKWKA